jgi:hypothetical protein
MRLNNQSQTTREARLRLPEVKLFVRSFSDQQTAVGDAPLNQKTFFYPAGN